MAREVSHGSGLHVARRAALERDAMVVHVVKKIPALDETAAMADAVSTAYVDRLGDGCRTIGLASVNRTVDVVVADELERVAMVLRRVVRFRSGEVESDDASSFVSHC